MFVHVDYDSSLFTVSFTFNVPTWCKLTIMVIFFTILSQLEEHSHTRDLMFER